MWDEKAIRTEKKRNKGSHINQLERLYCVLPEEAGLVFKKRKHYGGTSHGDCIGPIIAPSWDEALIQLVFSTCFTETESGYHRISQKLIGVHTISQ